MISSFPLSFLSLFISMYHMVYSSHDLYIYINFNPGWIKILQAKMADFFENVVKKGEEKTIYGLK